MPLGVQLDRADRDRPGLAGPLDAELDWSTDDVADEVALEVADALDRLAIELDHDVADAQPGARRRTRLEELDDLEPPRPADPGRDRLAERPRPADDPEEGAPDPAVDDEGVEDPLRRRVDRDGQAEPDARPRRC